MKKLMIRILLPLLTVVFMICCKKGNLSTQQSITGKTFVSSGGGNTFSSVGTNGTRTFAGSETKGSVATGTTSVEEEEEEEEEEQPTNQTPANSLNYDGTAYSSPAVNCGSTSNYFGITATAGSFTCTVYVASKPTANGTYSITGVSTGSPGAGKAWLVVQGGGSYMIANSGTVNVTVTGTKVTMQFSNVMVTDQVDTKTITGTLTCG